MRILVVEDNARVGAVISRALLSSGHTPTLVTTCATASRVLGENEIDLAIVDIGLPDGTGLELCRNARRNGHELPILFLTARTGVEDRVRGLDAGADDYLGKPFSTEELIARIRALGRRGPRWVDSIKTFGNIVIDRDRRVVTQNGLPAALTPREFEIVALLAWRSGRVVQRSEILEMVWSGGGESAGSSLEVLITRIRRKLSNGSEVVRTVRNVGYAWALEASKPR